MSEKWQQGQPVTMRCVEKWHETPDTVSFRLSSEPENRFEFKPGQFVNLGVEIDGKRHYRSYSLSSLPGESSLQLTVKRVDGGLVSGYLVERLAVGELLEVMAPVGEFNALDHPPRQKVLLVSAGCGITPVYSMACYWLAQQKGPDIQFLHVAKDSARTIYFDQLQTLDAAHPQFTLSLLLKDASGTDFPQGRLDQQWLARLVPDITERSVYLCGPEAFMHDVKTWFSALGGNSEHFCQESFTPEHAAVEQDEETALSVTATQFGTVFEVAKGALLADSIEQAGLPLIVACRSGICGSCRCKVTQGEVESSSTETLTEQQIADGYVLACSSTVQSDLALEIG